MAYGPLEDNPISSTIHLTKGTSIWLYVVTGLMGLATIVSMLSISKVAVLNGARRWVQIMAFLARKRVRGTRIFHQLATIILGKHACWRSSCRCRVLIFVQLFLSHLYHRLLRFGKQLREYAGPHDHATRRHPGDLVLSIHRLDHHDPYASVGFVACYRIALG